MHIHFAGSVLDVDISPLVILYLADDTSDAHGRAIGIQGQELCASHVAHRAFLAHLHLHCGRYNALLAGIILLRGEVQCGRTAFGCVLCADEVHYGSVGRVLLQLGRNAGNEILAIV